MYSKYKHIINGIKGDDYQNLSEMQKMDELAGDIIFYQVCFKEAIDHYNLAISVNTTNNIQLSKILVKKAICLLELYDY